MLKFIISPVKTAWKKLVSFVKGEADHVHLHVHIDAAELAEHLESAIESKLQEADAKTKALIKREIAKALSKIGNKPKRGR